MLRNLRRQISLTYNSRHLVINSVFDSYWYLYLTLYFLYKHSKVYSNLNYLLEHNHVPTPSPIRLGHSSYPRLRPPNPPSKVYKRRSRIVKSPLNPHFLLPHLNQIPQANNSFSLHQLLRSQLPTTSHNRPFSRSLYSWPARMGRRPIWFPQRIFHQHRLCYR